MIYHQRGFTPEGVAYIAADIDYDTRTVTEYDHLGETIGTRPFNDGENADADAMAEQAEQAAVENSLRQAIRDQTDAMRATIGPGDAAAGVDSLNALINTPNSVINASPAPVIKALARAVRELTRAVIRLARVMARDLDEPAE